MNWLKSLGVVLLLLLALIAAVKYTNVAFSNWHDAKEKVNSVLQKYTDPELNFGGDTDKKFQRWNETIDKRNEIDRTFFNALRDGFFGAGILVSIATLLSSLKLQQDKEENQDNNSYSDIELNQTQIEQMITEGIIHVDIANPIKIVKNGNSNSSNRNSNSSNRNSDSSNRNSDSSNRNSDSD